MRAAPWIAFAAAVASVVLAAPARGGAGVDDVHYNIGAAHSPQMEGQLAHNRASSPPGAARGVGVASYQEHSGFNWSRVAASGVQFAMIKATEGTY